MSELSNQTICEVKELRKSIENFLYMFDFLVEKYGFYPTYNMIRSYSEGNEKINEILDGLISSDVSYYVQYLDKNKSNALETKRLIEEELIEPIQSYI